MVTSGRYVVCGYFWQVCRLWLLLAGMSSVVTSGRYVVCGYFWQVCRLWLLLAGMSSVVWLLLAGMSSVVTPAVNSRKISGPHHILLTGNENLLCVICRIGSKS